MVKQYHQGTSLYETIKEKDEFFKLNIAIETESEIDQLWKQLLAFQQSKGLIFRGVPNAKFKLYNRSQRYFMENDIIYGGFSYEDYININLRFSKSWNNESLNKYLKSRNIENNDLACLSVMQHFGIPTPLLDFTYNPFIALYFSVLDDSQEKTNSDYDYSSLYMANSYYWPIKDAFQDLFSAFIKGNSNSEIKYENLKNIPFLLISESNSKFQIFNNQHIINQEGLFVFTYHPHVPIPEQLKMILNLQSSKGLIPDNIDILFSCWNINKKLTGYIMERLRIEKNITHQFLFPTFYDLKSDLEQYWDLTRKSNEGLKRVDFLKSINHKID